jgi:hypothetical protein
MCEKSLDEMTIEELERKLHKINQGVKFRKLNAGEDGALLLNPHDPKDREWYENDGEYGL